MQQINPFCDFITNRGDRRWRDFLKLAVIYFQILYLSLSINEKELIARSLAGQRDGFAVLYQKHVKAIYNSVVRITNDHVLSEDIVQDAFCVAFEQLGKLKDHENFEGWVKRIALNKAVSLLRKKKTVFISDTAVELLANDEPDADEEIIFQCKVEDVKEAIRNLPDGYRTILSLHLIENVGQEEIAKMLHISHSTVRSQYHRAKQKIFMALKNKTYHGKGSF